MTRYGNFGHLMTPYGNMWQLMAPYDGNIWQHVATYNKFQVAADRTILAPEGFPMAHLKDYHFTFLSGYY